MYPAALDVTEKSWVRLYPDGKGPDLVPEFGDALSMFRACVEDAADGVALRYFDEQFTYRSLDELSDALASCLQERGVEAGDRVAIGLQNTPEFVIMSLAAWKLAAMPLPINPMYRRGELAKIFGDAAPAALLCEERDRAEMGAALDAALDKPCIIITTDPRAFGLKGEFAVRESDSHDNELTDILQAHSGKRADSAAPAPEDLGLLLYTSGTTGVPKGAMITHASLAFNSELMASWCGLHRDSRVWALAPYFHITGFVSQMLATFSVRATAVLHYRFDLGLALDVIRKTRPTFTVGAITAFNALLNAPDVRPDDFESFERLYTGGAPVAPALVDTFEARLGLRIYNCYGMTETTSPTHVTPFGSSPPIDPHSGALSIGVPVECTDAAIVDDQDRPVPNGEIGEVVVRGPQIMQGYWRKPDETAKALQQGWMHTGDVGFRNDAGWFFLVDRKKDVIIASGFKVWPREVEDVLYMHPAVREAAVIGVPDDYRGENVKAYVSLKPGAGCEPAELIEHCRTRLAAYKVPRMIDVIEELPKTVTGKIQRVALREGAGT